MTRNIIIRGAAVQDAPVFLNLEATIDKCCRLIQEAGENGAQVIAFPEAFIPGYPYWIFTSGPGGPASDLYVKLYENALDVRSPLLNRLSDAARRHKIHVCVSATEIDRASLFLNQLWFDAEGNLIGKHRKLRPTGPERYIWGDGDGSFMPVMETEIGNLGGLLCWEHLVPLPGAAMSGMNEQIHAASWPSSGSRRGGPFEGMWHFRDTNDSMAPVEIDISRHEIISRYYAMSTQTFVLMSSSMLDQDALDQIAACFPSQYVPPGGGLAKIFAPDGSVISNTIDEDVPGIVYADMPMEMITRAKYMCDPAGHYGVPNVLKLQFNNARTRPFEADQGPARNILISRETFEQRV